MEPISIDCDEYNPRTVEKVEVSNQEWRTMLQAVGKAAKKERKQYPEDHKEIHPVGCEWTRSRGKWNADKSGVKN